MFHASRSLAVICSLVIGSLVSIPTLGLTEEKEAPAVKLDVKAEGVKRFVANQGQIGYTNTRVFYTLEKERAVVMVLIDNKNEKFPLSGKIYQFASDVTAEDLAKWLNNQHSDGLYPEIPEPVATIELPAKSITLVSSKKGKPAQAPLGSYDQYEVAFKVEEVTTKSGIVLAGFSDAAAVYIMVPQ